MSLYARYVGWVYLKSFLIIFFALELFYVGIDLLTNLKDLPSSANLQLLYVGMTSLTAISYVMPISLVFAIIMTVINMVRSNELVSFYALGVSKNALITVPFFISLFITLGFVGLNFTPFAYAYDYQKSIANGANFYKNTTDSFLKFGGKFIYIKELNQFEKSLDKVAIFDINGTNLNSVTFANEAKFSENAWILKDVNETFLPKNLIVGGNGLSIKSSDELNALSGFSPKSIQSANSSEKMSLSILDTLDFIFTFKSEGASINSAKSMLYTLTIAPFFAPFLLFIIYFYLPVTGRFFNLALASFVFVLVTLIIWGVLFLLSKFATSGVILPEIGIVLPVVCLFGYAIYLFKNYR